MLSGLGQRLGARRLLVLATLVLLPLLALGGAAQEPASAQTLKPGLVATYKDDAKPAPREHVAIEPGIALFLKPGEAPHPTLAADNLSVRWTGWLRILRADKYVFTAKAQGQFKLTILGKDVLNEQPLAFVPGSYPLVAEYTGDPGKPAQVQVFWQAKHFAQEPLPLSHLGHQPDHLPERWSNTQQVERGRRLVEEHGCTNCHKADASEVKGRQGPNLTRVGEWLKPAWVNSWLRDPKGRRNHAVMPQLLSNGDTGLAEAHALTQYLTSLGGPMRDDTEKLKPNELRVSESRGERLFNSVGCAACHGPESSKKLGIVQSFAIPSQEQRTGVRPLAKFLQDPKTINSSGRMPSLLLTGQEATDLARHLCKDQDPNLPPEQPVMSAGELIDRLALADEDKQALAKLGEGDRWRKVGEHLVVRLRCNACHAIEPEGKPLPTTLPSKDWAGLRDAGKLDQGCLAVTPGGSGVPRYVLAAEDRADIAAYFKSPRRVSPAPTYDARQTLVRLNCLACHSRDDEGGLSTAMVDLLKQYESAENAEAVTPPPLSGIGHKLQTSWMRQVLVHAGRARPWMSLRMPQFGEEHVGLLSEALTAADGLDPAARDEPPAFKTSDVEHGRFLAGKKAFGCIACHDIAGVPASGTRGPDLALVQKRVRYPWYRRWLEQPLRMQPGTRMPSVFTDGRSLMDEVLGGQADAQSAATWSYLSLGMSLPHPDGLEKPRGLVVEVKDKPVYLRTFMPDAGTRAIAVGFPEQVSIAFDAARCRLAYAWSGNFLDATPTWNDRGGHPARILGPRIWQGPEGLPLAFTTGAVPDFSALAKDQAYGAPAPEGHLPSSPGKLHFLGYASTMEGWPVFKYEVTGPDEKVVAIEEMVRPQRTSAAVGVTRSFSLQVPADVTSWLLLANQPGALQLLDERGQAVPVDDKTTPVEKSGRLLSLTHGDRRNVVRLDEAPTGAVWHFARKDGRWQVALKLAPREESATLRCAVTHWHPYRLDAEAVQELASRAP